MPDGPLLGVFGIVFYGVLANIFFAGGWISELLMRAVTTTEKASAFGLRAFRTGVYFSILLTLCPAVVCWLAFAVALLKEQKHGLQASSRREATENVTLPAIRPRSFAVGNVSGQNRGTGQKALPGGGEFGVASELWPQLRWNADRAVPVTDYALYLDDSGHPDSESVFVVAGYVATEEQWKACEPRWQAALKRFGLGDVFHMTDFMQERMTALRRDQILSTLADVVHANTIRPFVRAVTMPVYKKLNEEFTLQECHGRLTPSLPVLSQKR